MGLPTERWASLLIPRHGSEVGTVMSYSLCEGVGFPHLSKKLEGALEKGGHKRWRE